MHAIKMLTSCIHRTFIYYIFAEPLHCDKQLKLFLYIDTTASNSWENFCPLMVVLQMLVAAFNPSATSGTKIASLLFPDKARGKPPSTVFGMDSACVDAVEGKDNSLRSLLLDFGICRDKKAEYDSTKFPPMCGKSTSAVEGLEKIVSLASSRGGSTEGAVLMITDGKIKDDDAERIKVLNDLKSAGIRTLIAAGIGEADVANLLRYTSSSDILIKEKPIELGLAIVKQMTAEGVLCPNHGKFN